MNKIYNEDCLKTLDREIVKFDAVITSPPYNTSRSCASDKYNSRYDVHVDEMTTADYNDWTVNIFNKIDEKLSKDGVVLYNLSYSSENTDGIYLTIADIIGKTNFTVMDCISWKKNSAIPNNRSKNKVTRICEFIFVIARKSEKKTFMSNKNVVSRIERTGQANYENVFNFIEAKNNDGSCKLNKATFSSELIEKLIDMYVPKGSIIYDPFFGTGTTAIAAIRKGCKCTGSEISEAQVEFSRDRIKKEIRLRDEKIKEEK